MAKLEWDKSGEKQYHTGVSHGVLFVKNSSGYNAGVAWNGLTAVNESPSGAEANDIYADNMKYLSLISPETYGFTIEAYTSPDKFDECDGKKTPGVLNGIIFNQQPRKRFGFCWRTEVGDDENPASENGSHYIIHIVYDAVAAPSSKDYATISESPEAMTLSWECSCNPIKATIANKEYTLYELTIDSADLTSSQKSALDNKLYGDNTHAPALPSPSELYSLIS